MGTLIAYLDLRQQYDYLKATMDVLRGNNTSLLQSIRDIETAYERAADVNFWGPAAEQFDRLLEPLPERMWLE